MNTGFLGYFGAYDRNNMPALILLLLVLSVPAWGDSTSGWDTYMQAGESASQRADYGEAEEQWLLALKMAERFGPQDPRLMQTLNQMAALYKTLKRYAEAESLYQRLLTIDEATLGLAHPEVARDLDNLAIQWFGSADVQCKNPWPILVPDPQDIGKSHRGDQRR